MSPNINSFVGDLVAMAQAVEELPKVQAENERLTHSLDDALRTVQDRELAIIDYKSLIDSLNSRIRSLEVERDDASFRVLEAEDLTHNTLSRLRAIQTALGETVNALDPPKPEPESQPQAVSTTTDQSVADPTASTGQVETVAPSNPATSTDAGTTTTGISSAEEAPKSDANPTTNATDGEPKLEQTSVTSSANSDVTSAEVSKGHYFNKRYYDMPNYIPRRAWIDGGGTEADYDWRPSYSSQAG